jgi:ATPase subunit of ABC transporter with duplicated ATPase domains
MPLPWLVRSVLAGETPTTGQRHQGHHGKGTGSRPLRAPASCPVPVERRHRDDRGHRGPQPVAELRGIQKRYGTVAALRGVDLQLHAGELVALLGPNGAGETTAVSILLGQRHPDAGSAWLFGRDPTLPAARRPVGVTLQESGFPDNLTVAEVVDWSESTTPPAPTRDLLDRFGLAACRSRSRLGRPPN